MNLNPFKRQESAGPKIEKSGLSKAGLTLITFASLATLLEGCFKKDGSKLSKEDFLKQTEQMSPSQRANFVKSVYKKFENKKDNVFMLPTLNGGHISYQKGKEGEQYYKSFSVEIIDAVINNNDGSKEVFSKEIMMNDIDGDGTIDYLYEAPLATHVYATPLEDGTKSNSVKHSSDAKMYENDGSPESTEILEKATQSLPLLMKAFEDNVDSFK